MVFPSTIVIKIFRDNVNKYTTAHTVQKYSINALKIHIFYDLITVWAGKNYIRIRCL